jgi:hypothetical protein
VETSLEVANRRNRTFGGRSDDSRMAQARKLRVGVRSRLVVEIEGVKDERRRVSPERSQPGRFATRRPDTKRSR